MASTLGCSATDLVPHLTGVNNATAVADFICRRLDAVSTKLSDTTYLLFSAYLVFAMRLGYAFMPSPSRQNTMNIMLTNVLDAAGGLSLLPLDRFAFGSAPLQRLHRPLLLHPPATHDSDFFLYQWASL
ncbi:Ammonium transporter 1 member 2 [Camellia lanceoleosa]|uniref:Ammonium transporter 1 member 2 n=1 Tax=Camellia lanceoleosa TaxID=1840588 RepID=A0ACC0H671_9ERIC|nr:Ammonium transporter 1 member 2 [Camellia lanceoleosa]